MEHVIWRRGEPIQQSSRIKEEAQTVLRETPNPENLALEEVTHNKDRESMNDKINDRCLIKQLGQNPFLSGSYIDDLKIQEQFLRPKSSHTENLDTK
mgnify:CR=1 FL=1